MTTTEFRENIIADLNANGIPLNHAFARECLDRNVMPGQAIERSNYRTFETLRRRIREAADVTSPESQSAVEKAQAAAEKAQTKLREAQHARDAVIKGYNSLCDKLDSAKARHRVLADVLAKYSTNDLAEQFAENASGLHEWELNVIHTLQQIETAVPLFRKAVDSAESKVANAVAELREYVTTHSVPAEFWPIELK